MGMNLKRDRDRKQGTSDAIKEATREQTIGCYIRIPKSTNDAMKKHLLQIEIETSKKVTMTNFINQAILDSLRKK